MTNDSKISYSFKNSQEVAETEVSRAYFEEPFSTSNIITTDMIWRDSKDIPSTAPNIEAVYGLVEGFSCDFGEEGILRYFSNLKLLPVDGAEKSYYHPLLKNAIPYNWDNDGSYVYKLKSTFDIAFGVGDWLLDHVAGVLTFYGDVSSLDLANGLFISFYQYNGLNDINPRIEFPLSDALPLLHDENDNSKVAKFDVTNTGTTTYQLTDVEGGGVGKILLEENLNRSIDSFGKIDGGEFE